MRVGLEAGDDVHPGGPSAHTPPAVTRPAVNHVNNVAVEVFRTGASRAQSSGNSPPVSKSNSRPGARYDLTVRDPQRVICQLLELGCRPSSCRDAPRMVLSTSSLEGGGISLAETMRSAWQRPASSYTRSHWLAGSLAPRVVLLLPRMVWSGALRRSRNFSSCHSWYS